MVKFGEDIQVVPLLASVATTTPLGSAFVELTNAHSCTFYVLATTDTTTTITVECCSANATSGATLDQIGFKYRLSGAMGSDSWGAITAGTTAGAALTGTGGGTYAMLIDLDPAVVAATLGQEYIYARVAIAAGSNYSAATRTVTAFIKPRYGSAYIAS